MNGNYFIFKNDILALFLTTPIDSLWSSLIILLFTRFTVGTGQ